MPADKVQIDASGSSDTDGDSVKFRGCYYQQAGTYGRSLGLSGKHDSIVRVRITNDAAGSQLRVILTLENQNPRVPLTDYRRVVIEIAAKN